MSELAVYTILKAAPAVAAIVSTRIYPLSAPQGAAVPFVTYQRISGERTRDTRGPTGRARSRIQVDGYASGYAAAKTLANAVRQALDGYRGKLASIRVWSIALESDVDFFEDAVDPPLYRVSMDFIVTFDET